jgi:hypothetical protein
VPSPLIERSSGQSSSVAILLSGIYQAGRTQTRLERAKCLYDCINMGDIELFFLLYSKSFEYVFLVTETVYNSSGDSPTSKSIGIAIIRCSFILGSNWFLEDVLKEGAIINLV